MTARSVSLTPYASTAGRTRSSLMVSKHAEKAPNRCQASAAPSWRGFAGGISAADEIVALCGGKGVWSPALAHRTHCARGIGHHRRYRLAARSLFWNRAAVLA